MRRPKILKERLLNQSPESFAKSCIEAVVAGGLRVFGCNVLYLEDLKDVAMCSGSSSTFLGRIMCRFASSQELVNSCIPGADGLSLLSPSD